MFFCLKFSADISDNSFVGIDSAFIFIVIFEKHFVSCTDSLLFGLANHHQAC